MTKPASKPFPWKCANCHERAVVPATIPYSVEAQHDGRLYLVTVSDLEVARCQRCGEIVMIDAANGRITEELRKQLRVLSPEQIRKSREDLGLSQKQLADLLGISVRSLAYWETGLEIQSRASDRFLRLFFTLPEVRARLSEEALAS
jgi:putative zinc finger/helix-turn-helix YgiT family protein